MKLSKEEIGLLKLKLLHQRLNRLKIEESYLREDLEKINHMDRSKALSVRELNLDLDDVRREIASIGKRIIAHKTGSLVNRNEKRKLLKFPKFMILGRLSNKKFQRLMLS